MEASSWTIIFSGPFLMPLATAVLCGGMIGIERQIRGKPIGIRTSILICLGTEIFIRLGAGLTDPSADPTRVLGQVVTGVGFLGAGVILARGESITGVTSAAVVWVLAAIGSAIGLDHLVEAVVFAALTVCILIGVRLLEMGFKRLSGGSDEPDTN